MYENVKELTKLEKKGVPHGFFTTTKPCFLWLWGQGLGSPDHSQALVVDIRIPVQVLCCLLECEGHGHGGPSQTQGA